MIRRLARTMQEQGEEIRAEADRLVGLADAVPWEGWAAHAMRLRAAERATVLRRTACAHVEAAVALSATRPRSTGSPR
ncbi:MAG: hypothetical protein R2731_09770 [Nocardioides sp.]